MPLFSSPSDSNLFRINIDVVTTAGIIGLLVALKYNSQNHTDRFSNIRFIWEMSDRLRKREKKKPP